VVTKSTERKIVLFFFWKGGILVCGGEPKKREDRNPEALGIEKEPTRTKPLDLRGGSLRALNGLMCLFYNIGDCVPGEESDRLGGLPRGLGVSLGERGFNAPSHSGKRNKPRNEKGFVGENHLPGLRFNNNRGREVEKNNIMERSVNFKRKHKKPEPLIVVQAILCSWGEKDKEQKS